MADPRTGEIIAEAGETLTRERAKELDNAGVNEAVLDVDGKQVKVFANNMVDMKNFVDFDPEACGVTEMVSFPVLCQLLDRREAEGLSDEDFQDLVKENLDNLIPKHITAEDIMASINYLNCLAHGVGTHDDIDHLGNRRLRCVGELIQNQFRIGFSRMERVIPHRLQPHGAGHPGAHDHPGPGCGHPPEPHQYPPCHRRHQGVLRLQPSEPVHGPDQPPGRADPQAPPVRPGPRWSEP